MQLFASSDNQQQGRAIAMRRHEFGSHPYGVDEAIAKDRREGRVGPFPSLEEQRAVCGQSVQVDMHRFLMS